MTAEPKTKTERELVLAQRAAYRRGVLDHQQSRAFVSVPATDPSNMDNVVKKVYPLPTRPRVIKLSSAVTPGTTVEYRAVKGVLQYRDRYDGEWVRSLREIGTLTAEELAKIVDLLNNPNEDAEATTEC